MSSRGCLVVLRRDAAASRRRQGVSGGSAGRKPRSSNARRSRVSRIAPRGRTDRRGSCRSLSRRGSARPGAALAWGPRLIAGETGHPHATVWKALRRSGISRRPRQPREQPRLYEWPCPGDLLHIDSKRFVRRSAGARRTTASSARASLWIRSSRSAKTAGQRTLPLWDDSSDLNQESINRRADRV